MDEMQWTQGTPASGARLSGQGWSVTLLEPRGVQAVCGDLEAFRTAEEVGSALLGLCERSQTDGFLARTARDSALWVTPEPQNTEAGWRSEGYALSACDDAWAFIAVQGEAAGQLIGQGLSGDFTTPSPSASVVFAGQRACLVRDQGGYLLLWPTPMLPFIWSWFSGCD